MRHILLALVLALGSACSAAQTDTSARTVLLQLDHQPTQADVHAVVSVGGESPQLISIANAMSVYTAVPPAAFAQLPHVQRAVDLGPDPNPLRSVFVELNADAIPGDLVFLASQGAENANILETRLVVAEMRLGRVSELGSSTRISRVTIGQDDNVPQ